MFIKERFPWQERERGEREGLWGFPWNTLGTIFFKMMHYTFENKSRNDLSWSLVGFVQENTC